MVKPKAEVLLNLKKDWYLMLANSYKRNPSIFVSEKSCSIVIKEIIRKTPLIDALKRLYNISNDEINIMVNESIDKLKEKIKFSEEKEKQNESIITQKRY